jgi:molecular chaperone HscB
MSNNVSVGDEAFARSLCWSCRQEVGTGPFCRHCVKIQPIEILGNYFHLFGLQKSFNINPTGLRKLFLDLSRKFHPDFYADHSHEEQEVARDNAAYLNNAFNVLSDPVKRAEYLLTLESGTFSSSPAPPKDLFEEILEVGELLENKSPTGDEEKRLHDSGATFRNRLQELTDSLEGQFTRLLDGDKEIKPDIESVLNDVKYLQKTLARIDEALKNGVEA